MTTVVRKEALTSENTDSIQKISCEFELLAHKQKNSCSICGKNVEEALKYS
jgi:hypothetical protein